MKKTIISAITICVLLAHVVHAAEAQRKDLQVFNDIAASVNQYSFFTIFDAIDSGDMPE